MRKAKKTGKVTYVGVKRNIPNNFRGKEDIFWIKVARGMKKFLESPFNSSSYRDGSSPPSPVLLLAPIRFIAIAKAS